jgi:hypothetical protein
MAINPMQLKQSQAFNTPGITSRSGYRSPPSLAGGLGGQFGGAQARPGVNMGFGSSPAAAQLGARQAMAQRVAGGGPSAPVPGSRPALPGVGPTAAAPASRMP